jgi:hypothetical protein
MPYLQRLFFQEFLLEDRYNHTKKKDFPQEEFLCIKSERIYRESAETTSIKKLLRKEEFFVRTVYLK